MLTDLHLCHLWKNDNDADEAMDLLYPRESANARALAATRGVNTWSCLLPDDADLVFCRGLGDAIKSGLGRISRRRTPNQTVLGTE
jgi:hypothetical protein